MKVGSKSALQEGPYSMVSQAKGRGVEWGRRAAVCADDEMFSVLLPTLGRLNVDVLRLTLDDVEKNKELLLKSPEVCLMLVFDAEDAARRLESLRKLAPQMQVVLFVEESSQSAFLQDYSNTVVTRDAPEAVWVGAMRSAVQSNLLLQENQRLRELARTQASDLHELHLDVRVAIQRRQKQVCDTKAAWERTFDAIRSPLAIVDEACEVRAANRAYSEAADHPIQNIRGTICHDVLFSRASPCKGCPLETGDYSARETHFEVDGQEPNTSYAVSCYAIIPDEEKDHCDESIPSGEPVSAIEGAPEQQLLVCSYRNLENERSNSVKNRQMERSAAVGKLAAGVAHELNNPLGGILALAQVLLRDGPHDEETQGTLEDIEDAAQRCRRITRALLMFARGPQGDAKQEIDVQNVIDASLLVARGELKAAMANDEVTIESGLPPLFGWPELLQEALVALLENASQALLRSTLRRKVVSVRALRQEQMLWIEVSDNGPGIPDEEQELLGTPFMTSREKAEGAGLGLANVYRIMEKFEGHAEISSQPEGGTMVRLVFPPEKTRG
ncbi:MAG: GHKL domain-containing protein [Deltaproteobacteria bacterium]|nr:GHKL domain-containing protein [Deltaproteobacteria bacterium]